MRSLSLHGTETEMKVAMDLLLPLYCNFFCPLTILPDVNPGLLTKNKCNHFDYRVPLKGKRGQESEKVAHNGIQEVT